MLLTLSLACQRARPSKFDPVVRRLQHLAKAGQFTCKTAAAILLRRCSLAARMLAFSRVK
jgi:hypothetical protein